MSDVYCLIDEQMARLRAALSEEPRQPRVDNRRLLSGIVFVNRSGMHGCDSLKEYAPHKTLYNRWERWGEREVFLRMTGGLAAASATPKTIMINTTCLKAHLTASSLRVKKGSRAADRSHQGLSWACRRGGMNTKLHAVTDANSRPLSFFMTAGQVSEYAGAAAPLDDLPKARWLLGDRGYDADWIRDALQAKGIEPCILGRKIWPPTRQIRQAPHCSTRINTQVAAFKNAPLAT